MRNILVTGGAGFIGQRVVSALVKSGHQVRVLDNFSRQVHGSNFLQAAQILGPEVEVFLGDISDPSVCESAVDGVEGIVHLAAETGTAQSMYRIVGYATVNVVGTATLLEAVDKKAKDTVQQIVLASSRSVYGEGAYKCTKCSAITFPNSRATADMANGVWEHISTCCNQPLVPTATAEDSRIVPASIYASTKFSQELLVENFGFSRGIRTSILRLQNVYGPGQSLQNPYTGIISIFSNLIKLGKAIDIYEDGRETRDFVFVDDVRDAIIASLYSIFANCTVNVGSGVPTTVENLAKMLFSVMGKDENLIYSGKFRAGDIRHNFADVSQARAKLDWRAQTSLSEGLQAFAAWVGRQPVYADKSEQAAHELNDFGLGGAAVGFRR